jgi:maltose O-acetyltransferase
MAKPDVHLPPPTQGPVDPAPPTQGPVDPALAPSVPGRLAVEAPARPTDLPRTTSRLPGARLWRKALRRVRGWPDIEGLERAGLQLGRNVFVAGGAQIDPDFAWLIRIGDDTVISLGVLVLAHDASTRRHTGYTRLAAVDIGARVFIGARSVILPGVTIGDDAIVGAGSIVRHDVEPGVVVAGNPARVIATTKSYVARHRQALAHRPAWQREGWTVRGGITPENKRIMAEVLLQGEAYVE